MTPRLDVELFEIVPVSAGTVLLRLEGRWHAEARKPLPMPTLVVDDGRRSQRLPSLPGPDATPPQSGPEPELWRASYPMPAGLLDDGRIVFALDAGRGVIVDLPAPAPRGQGRRFSRSSGAELAHERTLRAQAERLADERRRALRDAEAELDRERSARAAETLRADSAESDLGRLTAELESQRDHARADASQHLRNAESAAGALAVAQARVRELDEALAAQRRRALEAESAAQSAVAESDARIAAERTRAAEALAAQRALAEEATRAQIAAQTQAREHVARTTDLEIARDALRDQLEHERERLRTLQAQEVAEATIEERRRSREQQARGETAEARLQQLTAELVTLAEERAHLQTDLEDARERVHALEAQIAQAPAATATPAEQAATALLAIDQPTASLALAPREELDEPALAVAEPGPAPGPVAMAAPEPQPEPQPEPGPEPEPSHAVSVFGPFGDAGEDRADHDDRSGADEALLASDWLDQGVLDDGQLLPEPAPSPPAHPPFTPHPPPRWDADDDLSFDLPPLQSPAGRRAARQREAEASMIPFEDEPRGRRRGRPGREVAPRDQSVVTRRAVLLGVVVAALVLVLLKVSGVIGAVTLASL